MRLVGHAEEVGELRVRYRKELQERRRLHNMVQELRGNIRVYCRTRPVSAMEQEGGTVVCASWPADGEICLFNNKRQTKSWEFDQVFSPTATNADVFKETEPLVVSMLDGACCRR
jgi:kinesin family protein C2/C3